jgi:hypothetical protein
MLLEGAPRPESWALSGIEPDLWRPGRHATVAHETYIWGMCVQGLPAPASVRRAGATCVRETLK